MNTKTYGDFQICIGVPLSKPDGTLRIFFPSMSSYSLIHNYNCLMLKRGKSKLSEEQEVTRRNRK